MGLVASPQNHWHQQGSQGATVWCHKYSMAMSLLKQVASSNVTVDKL